MLYTILQIIAFQALFLLVYDVFLKRETFFNCNRAYLLITSVLSLVLPFIKLPTLKTMATKDLVIQLPEVFIGSKVPTEYDILVAEQAGIIMEQQSVPIWHTVLFMGMALATLFFMLKMVKLYVIKHKNPKRWQGNVLIVNLIRSSAAFSFFNTIFMGERIPETEKITIYKHELVHIKELHSLDLLYFELLRIAMWFNPLVYLYQSRIKELHEYIADSKAVKQNGKADYYQSLLNQVFDVNTVSFTNTFFKKSLIKKRIAMLKKSKSKQLNLAKYILLLPMVFAMLIYTSTEVRAQEKEEIKQEVSQELTDEALIKKYYDEIKELDKDQLNNYSEIENLYNYSTKKYIPTEDEFLRYVAYMRYKGEQFEIWSKPNDHINPEKRASFIASYNIDKSYDEYLEYLKTDEAEKNRQVFNYNRTLQVISNDINNLTDEEHKDAYEKVIDVIGGGGLYRKVIIRDKNEMVEISKTNYDAILRFFTPDEIKSIMAYVDVAQVDKVDVISQYVEVPFSVIDEVPTTQECQNFTTNQQRKSCLSNFISKHVNRNFNADLADSLNLNGRQRIFVSFKIDINGNIIDIGARGPHPDLEVEAKRVIATLPKFIPGKHKGEIVTVPYSLPIVFQIHNETPKTEKYGEFTEDLNEIYERKTESDSIAVPFSTVDFVPAYVNCESIKSNEERKKCTSKAISQFVNKNFNTNLARRLNLPNGRKRVFVSFKIDTEGNVKNIGARGPHSEIEIEAIRVINSLPKFTPGKHNGKAVDVSYALPILFQVADASSYSNETIDEEAKINWHKENPNANIIPFLYLDELPVLPQCENFSKANLKSCFTLFIQEHVATNFDKDVALKNNLKGKQRIVATFRIDKKGNIKDVKAKAAHSALEAEAKRVIDLLPRMKPGKYNGKTVNTNYALPIVFEVAK